MKGPAEAGVSSYVVKYRAVLRLYSFVGSQLAGPVPFLGSTKSALVSIHVFP